MHERDRNYNSGHGQTIQTPIQNVPISSFAGFSVWGRTLPVLSRPSLENTSEFHTSFFITGGHLWLIAAQWRLNCSWTLILRLSLIGKSVTESGRAQTGFVSDTVALLWRRTCSPVEAARTSYNSEVTTASLAPGGSRQKQAMSLSPPRQPTNGHRRTPD